MEAAHESNINYILKMQALDKVLMYFGFNNIDIWNLYFCNSFLFNLKPRLNKRQKIKRVFPPRLFHNVRIPSEFNQTIIILRNYKALVCVQDPHTTVCVWYVVPIVWVRYIYYMHGSFYLSNIEFCCRHNVIHETEWPDYIIVQPMSIELLDDIRLFPSLFHFGISDCEQSVKCFKILELGGYYVNDRTCNYVSKFRAFLFGYHDFIIESDKCGIGFRGYDELGFPLAAKFVLSHPQLSKIIQIMFVCKVCYPYFNSFIKFLRFVVSHTKLSTLLCGCDESKINNKIIYDNVHIPLQTSEVKPKYSCSFTSFMKHPFVAILADHDHIRIENDMADMTNFGYTVKWNVSHYR